MNNTDRIEITWESVEIIEWRAVVTVAQFAELIGADIEDVLAAESPSDAVDEFGDLDLADELANIEDGGTAVATSNEFTRESIETRVRI